MGNVSQRRQLIAKRRRRSVGACRRLDQEGDPVPKSAPRRVTIVDVARHAQVSTTAVSKVLRNAYGASPAMRAKVQQSITELGYRPSAAARGLRGQTYTIGVMLPELRNLFFADILDGITAQLGGTDYQVLLAPG